MKDSIKREQSQAGLSFAERKNQRSLAGGESNFRPQVKNKLFLLLALLLTAATGAWAQEQWDVVWDFTAWSTETVNALKADAAASKTEGWSDVEKQADAEAGADPTEAAKDNCFWFAGTVNEDGSLSANGAVIKELKGLKFDSDYAAKRSLAIAVNYQKALSDYAGPAYLYLGGSKQTCFTIPGVKAGSKITIEVESHKTSSARGIGLYKNSYAAGNLIGEQFTPTTLEAKTWEIAEDCDVVVSNTNSCHIYTIKVKAPAAAPSSGYTVTMKDDVKDADKWTISPNPAEEGQTVTLTYTGRLKVKGVKATSDAAPAAVSLIVNPEVGQVIGADGKNYADAAAATAAGTTAVAKICYVGSDNGEAAPYNHGLALALSDANGGSSYSWKTSNTDAGHTTQSSSTFTEESGLQYNDTHNSDTYPAFKAAISYSPAAPTGCSAWFLPSGYQWQKMAGAVGGYKNLGLTGSNYYWSSSEYTAVGAWDFSSTNGTWYSSDKNYEDLVRACLAF